MSVKNDKIYLFYILESIKKILSYKPETSDEFLNSTLLQDAIVRNLEIMGEACKQVSLDFRNVHSDIPWKKIAGMRDVLIHNYMGVDLRQVWQVITTEILSLKEKLELIMNDFK